MDNEKGEAAKELSETASRLFDSDTFSDLTIKLKDVTFNAHRLILYARGDSWCTNSLTKINSLNWEHLDTEIGLAILKWVYTYEIDLPLNDDFVMKLMKTVCAFKLKNLFKLCEKKLIERSCFENCISFYTIAGEMNAESLKNHCAVLISKNWNSFTSKDFKDTSAVWLHELLKANAEYPLHSAVKFQRSDLVDVYLSENKGEVAKVINQIDSSGNFPLGLALLEKQTAIANTLCEYKADVNAKDQYGWSLLQRAIQRGDAYSAEFLISHNADVFCVTPGTLDTCLHLVCTHGESTLSFDESFPGALPSASKNEVSLDVANSMTKIGKILLEKGLDPSKKNADGFTPLHVTIMTKNKELFNTLLAEEAIDINAKTSEGFPPLWYALYQNNQFSEDSFAKKLLSKGAKADIVCSKNRESLLQLIIRENFEEAALFLLEFIPSDTVNLNHMNVYGETALHLAAKLGHIQLVSKLLINNANVNIETVLPNDAEFRNPRGYSGHKQTALHYAIIHHKLKVIEIMVNYYLESESKVNCLDCNLKDSNGNTPLSLALIVDFKEAIPLLLKGGADINIRNADGLSFLHQAIIGRFTDTAIFLLNNGADINLVTKDGLSPLQLCIIHQLPEVVDSLCRRGVDMSVANQQGHCPLWAALISGQEDIASILALTFNPLTYDLDSKMLARNRIQPCAAVDCNCVQYYNNVIAYQIFHVIFTSGLIIVQGLCPSLNGVDTDAWGEGPEGCYQTLLHKAIDESNESIAKFLIQSGCDLNSPRRPSPEGKGGDEAHDGYTPLHLCCQWGLVEVVQTLLEHGAAINKMDAEGKTPLHLAIENQHKDIIALLLCHPSLDLTVRDKSGLTPFAAALTYRNNKAAQAILDKLPTAAEQFNNKGQNFLHIALQNNQVENVLFLLSIKVDVNSRVKDSTQTPPLHLAAAGGNEVLVRSLILAGAKVNEVDAYRQTALHIAASKGHSVVVSALLQNGAHPDMCDTDGNNPLHIACKEGHLGAASVLLTESNLDPDMINLKGHNPLHVLAIYGKENAAAICNLFIETMPDFPLNKQDLEGNTALLLAYMKGNGNLCRALVKAGACLGCMNHEGITLFNYQVATKQLLTSLLDSLEKEPPWADGDVCLECGNEFTFTMRRHHCRHCGRLLCHKCSEQGIPIIKYNLCKPVRVCEVCFEVIQGGAS